MLVSQQKKTQVYYRSGDTRASTVGGEAHNSWIDLFRCVVSI